MFRRMTSSLLAGEAARSAARAAAALALGLGCALSGGGSAGGSPSESTPPTSVSSAPASLANGLDPAKCMDVSGASTAPGARLILFTCNGTAAQQFVWRPSGEIRYVANLCVATEGGAGESEGAIVTRACTGGADQQWRRGPGGSEIVGPDGRCIDVEGGNSADGTPLALAGCTGSESQMWAVRRDSSVIPGTR